MTICCHSPGASRLPAETAWIESHTITPSAPDRNADRGELRKATNSRSRKPALVLAFQTAPTGCGLSQRGTRVADFNGDGKVDIAAGNVYYAGPDWRDAADARRRRSSPGRATAKRSSALTTTSIAMERSI